MGYAWQIRPVALGVTARRDFRADPVLRLCRLCKERAVDIREISFEIVDPIWLPTKGLTTKDIENVRFARWDGDLLLTLHKGKVYKVLGIIPTPQARTIISFIDSGLNYQIGEVQSCEETGTIRAAVRWDPSDLDKLTSFRQQVTSAKYEQQLWAGRELCASDAMNA